MSGSWMLASALLALLLALAAMAVTRVAALYRGFPFRWIWLAAMAASVTMSVLWLRAPVMPSLLAPTSAPAAALPSAPMTPAVATPATVGAQAEAEFALLELLDRARAQSLPALPPSIDRVLLALWVIGSVSLLMTLIVAALRLRAERRGWTSGRIGDAPVLVSPRFGPAVVGVVNAAIVVPEWVLALDEPDQRIIVQHESEHRAAGDPLLLIAGLAALVAMPWNLGLWLQWRGLRRAIELDCDARVVRRGVESADYAAVLLGAWRRARGGWLSTAAFAERASGLGARVEHLMRPEPRRRAMRTTMGMLAGLVLVGAAWAVPEPRRTEALTDGVVQERPYPLVFIDGVKRADLPPRYRYVGPVVPETTTSPRFEIHYKGEIRSDTVASKLYPHRDSLAEVQRISPPTSEAHFGAEARYGATLYYTKRYRDAGGRMLLPGVGDVAVRRASPSITRAEVVEGAFKSLLRGITLTPQQAARAREILHTEHAGQGVLRGPVLAIWPKRIALSEARNSALRGLVPAADRATLEANIAEQVYRPVLLEEVTRDVLSNYLAKIELPAPAKANALQRVQRFLTDEVRLYEQAPADTAARAALERALEADLRQFISPADLPTFDARLQMLRTPPRTTQ